MKLERRLTRVRTYHNREQGSAEIKERGEEDRDDLPSCPEIDDSNLVTTSRGFEGLYRVDNGNSHFDLCCVWFVCEEFRREELMTKR